MSAYGEYETVMCEERYLVDGLTQMGFQVETHAEAASLYGYLGDERSDKAHVIIRRAQLNSASNDIGFVRGADGRYRAVLSEYDRSIGYDGRWIGQIQQNYKECQTMAVAKSKGYIFRGRKIVETPQGKKVQLQFSVR